MSGSYHFAINRSQLNCFKFVTEKTISRLSLNDVVDLAEDLHDLPSIVDLWASGNIPDVSPLRRFAHSLRDVTLSSDSSLSTPDPLLSLRNLHELKIGYARLSDVSFVSDLPPKLTQLWLSFLTADADLSPVSELKNLKELRFGGTGLISSIDFLAGMPQLSEFQLYNARPHGDLPALVQLIPEITALTFFFVGLDKGLEADDRF